MTLATVRSFVSRHGGLVVAASVILLGAVAAILAVQVVGQARGLAAGTASDPSPAPAIEPSAQPHRHVHDPSIAPDPTPAPADGTPDVTPVPTAALPAPLAPANPDYPWSLAGSFSDDEPLALMDVEAWNGRFIAVGTQWVGGTMEPRLWESADGRSWSSVSLSIGRGVSLQTIAPLPDGRLMLLGTVGGSVEFWSDPERAAGWISSDGRSWSSAALPFGEEAVTAPVRFAAGAEGIVATTGTDVWHSTDGLAWLPRYHAPRGTTLYNPIAGAEGWIVERSNASLWTTTLIVSGDAVTWHEVDLGNVATVGSVAGDWLAARRTDDWSRTEILISADGLEWSHELWLDEMAPPDGSAGVLDPTALGGAILTGTDDVLVMSPWQGGHCGWMPGGGWGAWLSTERGTWSAAGLGGDAVVTHAVEMGEMTVLAGYMADTGGVTFWVSGS